MNAAAAAKSGRCFDGPRLITSPTSIPAATSPPAASAARAGSRASSQPATRQAAGIDAVRLRGAKIPVPTWL